MHPKCASRVIRGHPRGGETHREGVKAQTLPSSQHTSAERHRKRNEIKKKEKKKKKKKHLPEILRLALIFFVCRTAFANFSVNDPHCLIGLFFLPLGWRVGCGWGDSSAPEQQVEACLQLNSIKRHPVPTGFRLRRGEVPGISFAYLRPCVFD